MPDTLEKILIKKRGVRKMTSYCTSTKAATALALALRELSGDTYLPTYRDYIDGLRDFSTASKGWCGLYDGYWYTINAGGYHETEDNAYGGIDISWAFRMPFYLAHVQARREYINGVNNYIEWIFCDNFDGSILLNDRPADIADIWRILMRPGKGARIDTVNKILRMCLRSKAGMAGYDKLINIDGLRDYHIAALLCYHLAYSQDCDVLEIKTRSTIKL